jgi:hypothetical protein
VHKPLNTTTLGEVAKRGGLLYPGPTGKLAKKRIIPTIPEPGERQTQLTGSANTGFAAKQRVITCSAQIGKKKVDNIAQ